MAHARRRGRPATGTVKYVPGNDGAEGHFDVRITCLDGSRPWIDLDPTPGTPKWRKWARRQAKALSDRARREGIVAAPRRRTATALKRAVEARGSVGRDAWWEEFFGWRAERGDSSWQDDRGRYVHHILSVVSRHMADVTRGDCEDLRDELDRKIVTGSLSWKTAWNVWSVWTTACKAACSSKKRHLRVRGDNPCTGVDAPERGFKRSKSWLWPSEFLTLVSCPDVPLRRRRVYCLAVYLYERGSELRAQAREDIDLEVSVIHVHQAMDRNQRDKKDTKTGVKRRFRIEPNLMPLLRVMFAEGGTEGPLTTMRDRKYWSTGLRKDLHTAGVTREDLFANDKTRMHITFHDLKATAVTWMAIRGDDPLKIMQRAAHKQFSTTQGYLRAAEMVGDAIGTPFPELPRELLGDGGSSGDGGAGESSLSGDNNSSDNSSVEPTVASLAAQSRGGETSPMATNRRGSFATVRPHPGSIPGGSTS